MTTHNANNERIMMIIRLTGCVLACLALAGTAAAQQSTFESLTIDATSGGVALASTTYAPTGGGQQMTYCVGKLETANIRMRDDGTAPSTTVGVLIESGDVVALSGTAYIRAALFIRTTGTSGTIQFQCYPEAP